MLATSLLFIASEHCWNGTKKFESRSREPAYQKKKDRIY